MRNKFINLVFFAFLGILFQCFPGRVYAQKTDNTVNVSSNFIGSWKEVQDPSHLLDIYREGSLTIVCKRSEKNDGTEYKKYVVLSEKGNRIMIDFGYGSSPLTISDDGSKIYFAGQEYIKK